MAKYKLTDTEKYNLKAYSSFKAKRTLKLMDLLDSMNLNEINEIKELLFKQQEMLGIQDSKIKLIKQEVLK